MTENRMLTPTCDDCGEPIDPRKENCWHVEGALPKILDGGQKSLLRRVLYLERVVAMLVDRFAESPAKRRGRPPKAAINESATPLDAA